MERKGYLEEKTVSRINNLLNDSDISDLLKETTELLDTIIEGDDIPEVTLEVFHGAINIEMEPMKMTATLEIVKPINSENVITIRKIKDVIHEYGTHLESRVDWNLVHELFDRVINDDEIVPPVIIAKGTKVEAHIPEHIIIEEELYENYKPFISKKGNADYHHIHSLIFVEKNQYLGNIIPDVAGINGENLEGKIIPFPTIVKNNYVIDENVYEENGKIFSKIEGTFRISENKIQVSPCLHIASDLDYHTGDIKYKGDIEIDGSVRSGFKVESGGNIHIQGVIEPTSIICKRNMVINQGIFGSSDTSTVVEGKLMTKHIENAFIKVADDIEVENSIINSSVYTNGRLILGEKGSIIGKEIYSLNGITCYNIGNETGVRTEINLGFDFKVMDKLNAIRTLSETITREMENLQTAISAMTSREEKDKGKYLFLSLKNRLDVFNTHSRELLKSLDRNDRSRLIVVGTVYPGTRISICHISKTIKEPITNAEIYLNKDQGRIDYTSPI